MTTIVHVVLEELLTVHAHQAITSLIDLRVVSGAGLTHFLDTILKEVVVDTGVILTESLLKIRMLVKVELKIKNLRAGTAFLDTILMPVVVELTIIVMESILKIRILVVIEVSIENEVLHGTSHGRVADTSKAHTSHQALRITLVLEVPEQLTSRKVSEPWVESLVHLGVVHGAGLTELVDTILKEVVVDTGVVLAESLLKIGVLLKVVLKVEDAGASTTFLDNILMPMVVELAIVMVESILKIRILVVIEICIEDNFFHVGQCRVRRYHIQHHFRKGFLINIKLL